MSDNNVAIVGAGPRSLWALERLSAAGAERVDSIDVFADANTFGTGWAYAPDQPDWILMNVPASLVNCWPDGDGPSLVEWAKVGAAEFVPRSLVGRYLREQATEVLRRLAHVTQIEVHRQRVREVHGEPGAWSVDGSQPRYHQVLLCTGHEPRDRDSLRDKEIAGVPLVGAYPSQAFLGDDRVPTGATLVVRGAALSAIDVVMGVLARRPDVSMVLVSRTGRLMHPKGDPARIVFDEEQVARAKCRLTAGESVPEVLIDLAASALDAGRPAVLSAVDSMDRRMNQSEARADLAAAIAAAEGENGSASWALAQAWRALYAEMVARQRRTSRGVLDWSTDEFGGFHRWARALERTAFGPCLRNSKALAAALDDGQVRLSTDDVPTVVRREQPALVVDAVLSSPGIDRLCPDTVLGRLVSSGRVRQRPGCRGADVGPGGAVPDAPGLAIIGRATEDVVLGTDTLARHLHLDIDQWAHTITTGGSDRG